VLFRSLREPYLFPKAGPVRRWVNLALANGSDLAIVTNEEDYAQLSRQVRTPVRLVPIGSNIPVSPTPGFDRAAWRDRLGVRPEQTLLAYFGFINSSKGLDVLVEALARRREQTGKEGRRLVMVGGGVGDTDPTNRVCRDHLLEKLARLQLDDAVIWTNYVDPPEISATLLSADMAVFPFRDGASFRRGSLMAALSHGLPVISTRPREVSLSTDVSGLPRLVDGENVLLVPAGDPEALAAAIERLSLDPALRQKLHRGALELAGHFEWDRIAAELAGICRELVENR
jgi:glycosyltransferase involved in cell wall biosynthesis